MIYCFSKKCPSTAKLVWGEFRRVEDNLQSPKVAQTIGLSFHYLDIFGEEQLILKCILREILVIWGKRLILQKWISSWDRHFHVNLMENLGWSTLWFSSLSLSEIFIFRKKCRKNVWRNFSRGASTTQDSNVMFNFLVREDLIKSLRFPSVHPQQFLLSSYMSWNTAVRPQRPLKSYIFWKPMMSAF